MNNIKDIFLTSTSLSSLDYCDFLDHYIFSDPLSGVNIFYPLTAFGGPFTGEVSFTSVTSGGPLEDICFQDYCFRSTIIDPIKIYCVTTVNYKLSGLDESDGKVIKIIYDFGDNSEVREISFARNNNTDISPKDITVSKTYYPTDKLATTYLPSISVIRSDCCINTYRLTLSTFKCSILEIYEDVVLHNAQQTKGFDIVMTMERLNSRQLFNNALNINDLEFAIPTLSSLPYLVEPVPPSKNKPNPGPVDPKQPSQPIDQNPVIAPEPGYYYTEGDGIDMSPNYFRIVPSEDIETVDTSGITISGDGPPYMPGEGVDIRYT